MRIRIYEADEIRGAVNFTDLIEPLRQAFADFSSGRAQQTMSVLWPGRRPEDGDVLIKAGCVAGHDIFVVKAAAWFRSNQAAGRPQGGLVNVLDSSTGYPRRHCGFRTPCARTVTAARSRSTYGTGDPDAARSRSASCEMGLAVCTASRPGGLRSPIRLITPPPISSPCAT